MKPITKTMLASSLATLGATQAQATLLFDEADALFGKVQSNPTQLPAQPALVKGGPGTSFFAIGASASRTPFIFTLQADCAAASASASFASASASVTTGGGCSGLDVGAALLKLGTSDFSGLFGFGFVGDPWQAVRTGDASASSSASASDSSSASASGSGSSSTSGGTTGGGPSPLLLGPMISFFDAQQKLILSFELPLPGPGLPPLRIKGEALDDGQIYLGISSTLPYRLTTSFTIPEPATGALLAIGGLAAAAAARARHRAGRDTPG